MSDSLRHWLSQELERRNWSHNELARQTGVSQSYVTNILNGKRKPSVNFCNRVAKSLDVAPAYLLSLAGLLPGEPTPADPGPITSEILQIVEALPPEKRRQLLEYAKWFASQP